MHRGLRRHATGKSGFKAQPARGKKTDEGAAALGSLLLNDSAAPFTFVHMSDVHVGHHDEAVDTFRQAIREVNALRPRPRFILVTGDLGQGERGHYREYRRIIADSTVPVQACPGNHDVGGRMSERTPERLRLYRDEIGPDYHSFSVGPLGDHVQFILLNSLFMRGSAGTLGLRLRHRLHDEVDAQWRFLEAELHKATHGRHPARSIIVGFHHLPYAVHPKGLAVGYLPINRAARRRLFALSEQYEVQAILSGHAHWSRAQEYRGTALITTPSISFNSPIGLKGRLPLGFRVMTVGGHGLTHRYKSLDLTAMADVPKHLGIRQVDSDGAYVLSLDAVHLNPRAQTLAV